MSDQSRSNESEELPRTQPTESDAKPSPQMGFDSTRMRVEIELPWRTILRLLFTLGILAFVLAIRGVLLEIFVGMLLAAALFPLVWYLEQHHFNRAGAATVVMLGLLGILIVLVLAIGPPLVNQATDFWNQTPTYARDALAPLKTREPLLYSRLILWVDQQTSGSAVAEIDVHQLISGGASVFSFLAAAVAAIAVAAFTLTTGDDLLRSIGPHLPRGQEDKIRRLAPDVVRVVKGYVVGQTINSSLFAVFTFVLFTALGLPSAIVAAGIAFVLDAVPLVGATLATAIFAAIAFTNNTQDAIIVVVACLVYQQFENHVTSPRVFGKTLRISPFVSLISVLIGAKLFGIPGVLMGPPAAALVSSAVKVWKDDIQQITESDEQQQLQRD